MRSGYARNAQLSRAAILAAAGGALISMSQAVPQLTEGAGGKVVLAIGGVLVVGALVAAITSLTKRRGDADQ
ncbi:hypothetical protein [Phenylobacterium sp. J367]|uniref:hypothetical protein n=1 Tax=Phenylobacterium sp. J367 TaxID=2898435 RepID=UPI0021512D28|nr:hypothetical protein [Phenylobacterium sp. J367]MCR5878479.1 hypothetical protein [Phenylobacterium sp. J367]